MVSNCDAFALAVQQVNIRVKATFETRLITVSNAVVQPRKMVYTLKLD